MRNLLAMLAVLFAACSGNPSTDGGSGGGGGGGGGGAGGGGTDACGGCDAGSYCWTFSNICQMNGTCPAAGINTSMTGLCSCDGFAATACPAGQTCPTPSHGHATFCQ